MNDTKTWRAKARLYRELGTGVDDPALRDALLVAADVYSIEAERISCCGTSIEPSAFQAFSVLAAGRAPCADAEPDEDETLSELAQLMFDSGDLDTDCSGEADGEEGLGTAMDAGFLRQQAARYRKRAEAIAEPADRLALLNLALTCEKVAEDLELREARRYRAFSPHKPH